MKTGDIKKCCLVAVLALAVCVAVRNFSVISEFVMKAVGAVMPLVTGCVIAYVFNIIMTFFEKHYFPKRQTEFVIKSRRPVCTALAFASAFFIIIVVVSIVYPEIVKAVKIIAVEIPPFFSELQTFAKTALREYPQIQNFINSFEPDVTGITEKIGSGAYDVFGSLISIIGSAFSVITNAVIAVIFAVYLLICKDRISADIRRFLNAYIGEKANRRISYVIEVADDCFRSFFVGQFIDACILGLMCFIGMSLLRLPYSAMAGTIVGVTALVPIVGALLGAFISAFLIFTVNPMQAVIFLIFLVILQQLEENLIYPKIVGASVGLPSIWVIASVVVGGGLFGVVGMLLGVPFFAVFYKLIFEILERRENHAQRSGISE
ncbi:MAG: AI-2E family transporter [Ruminococcus sp.]|nr:AI-2E family transporter [Ruminococcus sp.]